jgi:C1A family cysteine protease
MKTSLLVTFLGITAITLYMFATVPSSAVQRDFELFLQHNAVSYNSMSEYDFRLQTFNENVKTIEELKKANPHATFAINKFADRTPEEMKKRMGYTAGMNAKACEQIKIDADVSKAKNFQMYMGQVKDQGQCGSCWAFSAIGAAEGRYNYHLSRPRVEVSFSESQLVDCDTTSAGCNGGLMETAFEFFEDHDMCSASDYPYDPHDRTCHEEDCKQKGIRVSSCSTFRKKNDEIVTALENGPVAVAVDASSWSFYSGGVLTSCGKSLNHGVTLVAYKEADSENDIASVVIRNSWGPNWGEEGHIRLGYEDGVCGWDTDASIPNFE